MNKVNPKDFKLVDQSQEDSSMAVLVGEQINQE